MNVQNGEIKVEKGIPIPPTSNRGKYPWLQMEVGDSFFAPGRKTSQIGSCYNRIVGKTFRSRTRIENGVKGVRVWRIE